MNDGHDEQGGGVVTELADREACRLLGHLPHVSPGAEARVRGALRRSLTRREPAGRPWALAAVGAVGGGGLVALGVWAGLAIHTPEVVPVALALTADHDWDSEVVGSHVKLAYQGVGEVDGDSVHPRIRWERGVVNVEVTPERGIDLSVETREATVRVVGTGFTVRRDALGTAVEVQHGRVEVRCAGEEAVFVDAGGERSCLPTSAAGMLGRARSLEGGGADVDTVLAAVDRGLALVGGGGSGPVADELRVMRVHHLLRAGRRDEAVTDGLAHLEGSTGRELEMARMVAAAQLESGGCTVALPTLERAAGLPEADADDLAARDACRAALQP